MDDSFSAVDGAGYLQSLGDYSSSQPTSSDEQQKSPSAAEGARQQYHHVAVDEIIQLSTANSDNATSIATKNTLGTLPLGKSILYTRNLFGSIEELVINYRICKTMSTPGLMHWPAAKSSFVEISRANFLIFQLSEISRDYSLLCRMLNESLFSYICRCCVNKLQRKEIHPQISIDL